MCFGGTNTVTQNSSPPANVLQNYQNLVGQATGVSNSLQGLGGPPVADWNNELTSGIGNINQAGNAVNYFNQGLGALESGLGTVGGALDYLPSEISGIGAAQSMIPGAAGLVGSGASTLSGALPYYSTGADTLASAAPYYGAAGSTISGALPMYGQAAGIESSALPYYGEGAGLVGSGASTIGGGLSAYGSGLSTLGSASPYFGEGASEVGASTVNPFTSGEISQYMSPYISNVVNSTEQQFNNQNAQQANQLTGSAILGGNAFGGDRAGVAQAVLAGQQQSAEAPVIAGLYNTGYQTAGQEATQEQGLLQSAGSLYGSLGQGLGQIGSEYGALGSGITSAGSALGALGSEYGSLGSGVAGVGAGIGSLASGEVGAGSALGSVGAGLGSLGTEYGSLGSGVAGVGTGLGSLGSVYGGLAGTTGSLAGLYGSAAGVAGGLGATQAGIGSQISSLGPAYASTLEGLGGAQLTGGQTEQSWEQAVLNSQYQQTLNQLGLTGTQFLAPIVEGTGSLSGGTGTTTSPGPSAISQAGGLGLTGLALNQLTGGGLTSGLSSLLGGLGGTSAATLGATSAADYLGTAGISSLGGDAALALGLVKRGGRINYDDGGSVDDGTDDTFDFGTSGNQPQQSSPAGGLGGIVGYNALMNALKQGASGNQIASSLTGTVGFADGGVPTAAPQNGAPQPVNLQALLQGQQSNIPGQFGMSFQRGSGPPGMRMGMGPPQPPRPDQQNSVANLMQQVNQVASIMRAGRMQNNSSPPSALGGRIAPSIVPQGFADGGSPDSSDDALPANSTPDIASGDITPVNQANWDRWLKGQSFLESPGGEPSQSSSAKGYFQFIDGTARRATNAGLPNPQVGSYDQQADATQQYIQHFHPSAADAINSGDFSTATQLLNREWPSLPGGSQMQSPSQYSTWQGILGGGTIPSGLASAQPTGGGIQPATPSSLSVGKPNPWESVLAAGLGMMAGTSPFAMSNIGQGGLAGLQNYQQQQSELREEAGTQLAAQRLSQEAAFQQGQLKNESARTSVEQQNANRQIEAMNRQYALDYYKSQTTPVTIQGPFGAQTAFRHPNGDLVDSQGNLIEHGQPMPGYVPQPGASSPTPQGPSTAAQQIYTSLGDDGQVLNKNNIPVGMEATNQGAMNAYKLGLHGPAMASAIPPQARAIVESIANYQMPLTELSAAQSRYNMSMSRGQAMQWVKAINPDFNESVAKDIPTELRGFMEGGPSAPASVLNAIRTAEGHAGEMSDALDEMRRVPGGDTLIQQVATYAQTHNIPFAAGAAQVLSNSTVKNTAAGAALAKYEVASTLYGTEVARAYSGKGPTDTGREEVLAPFSTTRSLQELTAALHTSVNMLDSKNQAVRDQYDTITKDAPGLAKYGPKDQTAMWPQLKYVNEKGQSAIDRINQRYTSTNPNLAASDRTISQGSARPQTVVQNGHTYTLGADGNYH